MEECLPYPVNSCHCVITSYSIHYTKLYDAVDYYYSEDILFDRQVEGPTGKGISFDLHAGLTITQNMTIEILIEDLWSKIRWEDAPHTSADGDTDTVLITDEGYLKTKALLIV